MPNVFDRALRRGFNQLLQTAGESRSFGIQKSDGTTQTITATVIWSHDATKRNVVANAQGIFLADVLVAFKKEDLPRVPLAGELLESPRHTKWFIADVGVQSDIIELSLVRQGSL